ncbi:MAG: hypothetical protein LBS56_07475 [Propionibacteriaceae bacterium]|jgi:hypothetical protein|nr:hypothetical protein [Propionibacteriaceae bacterium]
MTAPAPSPVLGQPDEKARNDPPTRDAGPPHVSRTAAAAAGPRPDSKEGPELRPLIPAFIKDQHEPYLRHIEEALKKPKIMSIALAGPYGCGKSSILAQLEKRRRDMRNKGSGPFKRRRRGDVINLSLPTTDAALTLMPNSLASTGNAAGSGAMAPAGTEDLTNTIQKEIVKQILSLRSDRGVRSIAAVAVFLAVLLVLVLFGPRGSVASLAQTGDALPAWLTADLTAYFLAAFLCGSVAWLAAGPVARKLHWAEASIGPAAIKLSRDTATYFDEYLDEIVHFFDGPRRPRIVIFEDLDRFDDPHIFEALRSLNLILNKPARFRKRPVCFIYAIRDSIFEPRSASEGSVRSADTTGAVVAARAVTDRTKFFDLIIPVVPFVSARNSQELVRQQFADLPEGLEPSADVLHLVAPYLPDMRLIINVRNEYRVFANQLAGQLRTDQDQEIPQIERDRLLAMVVYKNLFFTDFERIALGTSNLDKIYRHYRLLVNWQLGELSKKARELREHLLSVAKDFPDSGDLGRRLLEVVEALKAATNAGGHGSAAIETSKGHRTKADVEQSDFWRDVEAQEISVRIPFAGYGYPGSSGTALTLRQLAALLGRDPFQENRDDERERSGASLAEAEMTVRFLRTASIKDLLARADLMGPGERPDPMLDTLENRAEKILGSDSLACALLARGLIDENFTCYATQYNGRLSRRTLSFVLHNVQTDQPDPAFCFRGNEDHPAVSEEQIGLLIEELGERLLGRRCVYNIEIFDYLLIEDPGSLLPAIRSLVSDGNPDKDFIDNYMTNGREQPEMVKLLSSQWKQVFCYLGDRCAWPQSPAGDESVDSSSSGRGRDADLGDTAELLNAALRGVLEGAPNAKRERTWESVSDATPGPRAVGLDYDQNDFVSRFLTANCRHLRCFTEPLPDREAQVLADLAQKWNVLIENLSEIAQPQLKEFISLGCYPLTAANVIAACYMSQPNPGAHPFPPLNRIRDVGPPSLYHRVTRNPEAYLEVLPGSAPSIAGAGNLLPVLDDVREALATDRRGQEMDPEERLRLIADVAERAHHHCRVADLTKAADYSALWPALARAGRFDSTLSNLLAYLNLRGSPDTHLTRFLERATRIETTADSTKADKAVVAAEILSAAGLDPTKRLALVGTLGLSEPLEPAAIKDDAIVPLLIKHGVVSDNQAVFTRLKHADWAVKKELLLTSKRTAENLTALSLTSMELHEILEDPGLFEALASPLAQDADVWAGSLDPETATILAGRAVSDEKVPMSPETLFALAKAGADQKALPGLAARCLASPQNRSELPEIFRAMGAPYAVLANRRSTVIDADHADTALFHQLRQLGFKIRKQRKKEMWDVAPPDPWA